MQRRPKSKVRAILVVDSIDLFLLQWLFLDFNERFAQQVNSAGWPYSVGDSIFHGGADRSSKAFLSECGEGYAGDYSDISKWDGSLQGDLVESVGEVMLELLSTSVNNVGLPDGVIRGAGRRSISNIANGVVHSPWGEVMLTESGMKTGTYLTTTINSCSNHVISAYSFFRQALAVSRPIVNSLQRAGFRSTPADWFKYVKFRL